VAIGFAAIRNKAAAVIEALTPDTVEGGSDVFREHRGMGSVAELAGSSNDRRFEVTSDHPPAVMRMGIVADRTYRGPMAIRIVYLPRPRDPGHARNRFYEDVDLITRNVTAAGNFVIDASGANPRTTSVLMPDDTSPSTLDEVTGEDQKMLIGTIPFTVEFTIGRP